MIDNEMLRRPWTNCLDHTFPSCVRCAAYLKKHQTDLQLLSAETRPASFPAIRDEGRPISRLNGARVGRRMEGRLVESSSRDSGGDTRWDRIAVEHA